MLVSFLDIVRLNERGQLEKIGLLIAVLIGAVVVSAALELGDPYKLSVLIAVVFALLLVYIGLK
jgi:uncharacterized membrane protein